MTKETTQWRHCLLTSTEGGEGTEPTAIVWWLDSLDAQGVPQSRHFADRYAAFQALGRDGWRLIQVVEHAASTGMDGPMPSSTDHYFRRPARGKG